MNTPNSNNESTPFDEYHDRLVDRGLAEILGQEAPPDLSGRILAEASARQVPVLVSAELAPKRRLTTSSWVAIAIAASLLICATGSLFFWPVGMNFLARSDNALSAIVVDSSRPATPTTSKPFPPNEPPADAPTATASAMQEAVTQFGSDIEVRFARESQQSVPMPSAERAKDKSQPASGPSEERSSFVELYNNSSSADGAVSNGRHHPLLAEAAPGEVAAEAKGLFFDISSSNRSSDRSRGYAGGYGGGRGGYGGEAGGRFDRFGGYGEGGRGTLVPQLQTAEGTGPGLPGDQYARIFENPFIKAEGASAVSTFSIDVDTASYANVRQFLLEMNTLPPPDAVRIEELINYFDYDYAGPPANAVDTPDVSDHATPANNNSTAQGEPAPGSAGGSTNATASHSDTAPAPFAAHVEVAGCPWQPEHRLVRIGIKGREMDRTKRPQSNLVFLVDVSGSMNEPNKLPLVVYGLEQLTRELGENDRVAIVVYASSEGLVLPSTHGDEQQAILTALGQLRAGGSTAGGAGIQLAYQIAQDNFIEGGTNRVILCTDGDFNVGVTSTAELQRLCETKAKDTGVFLSVLGFGRGNLNDAMMEAISNRGNGNYHYVDNRTEARRVLVEEMTGTLVTIAKDVKIQVEFNPRQVAGYRLIGYENRLLRTEDFNDDTKDAGEIGAGHTVTALYEIVPAGKAVDVPAVDPLKYQSSLLPESSTGWLGSSASEPPAEQAEGQAESRPQVPENKSQSNGDVSGELLTLKMRYKQPAGTTSRKLEWPVADAGAVFSAASKDFQFATAVAGFGLLLRDSQYKGNLTFAAALEMAQGGSGQDEHGYRAEFLELVRRAQTLRGE